MGNIEQLEIVPLPSRILAMAFSLLARFSLLALPLVSALSVSRQIQLEDVDYFVPPEAAWNLDAWDSKDVNGTDEFVPLSAITLNGTANAQRVRAMLEAYNTTDDVWTPSFSQGTILGPSTLHR